MSTPPEKHQAAIVPQKGGPFAVVERKTPTPGPKELLVEVRAVAVNPVDHYQRDYGIFIQQYPAIVGSDIAGVVVKTGSDVRPDAPKPGARVAAFSSAFYNKGNPDYGALQRYVLVGEDSVAVLPDAVTFVEGSVFPMAANVTWNGLLWIGVPREISSAPKNEGVLVWGASSSMGALAVQAAKLAGYTVYATASAQHHEYLQSLGATKVFDYKADDVQSQIVGAAKKDGLKIRLAHLAAGSQQLAVDVVQELSGTEKAKLAIAPQVAPDLKVPEGVEIAFVLPPDDPEQRNERFRWVFGGWLQEKLATSPHIKVVEGGLEAANQAMEELKAGVSCTKLVLEL
ncbi:chaperonin 10-like protein [Penicillium hispanicum]|uniref:chaperonin 10-like protein n=1 Tax=Penicillium hispanicum TaxID=1080232 RepID=UPI002540F0D6|nr:chaperonin 10-like protein [Penicillium hispanicum]KAJ5573993.1 chaperonin 10-like protein [Penicillium hispanicum]